MWNPFKLFESRLPEAKSAVAYQIVAFTLAIIYDEDSKCLYSHQISLSFLLNHFYYYSITVVPILPLFPAPSILPLVPTVNPHTVYVHGSFIHVLSLVPSPSFHHYPPSPPIWSLSVYSLFPSCGSILLVS